MRTRHDVSAVAVCALAGLFAACASTGALNGREQAHASPTSPARSCFDVSQLSAAEQLLADRIVLEFSDREGLYTLAGGLKPMSSDVRNLSFRIAPIVDTARLAQVEQLRRVAASLHCGDIGMFVQVFTATFTSSDSAVQRSTSLVMYHRASMRRAVERHAAFFATLGVTPSADPRDIVDAVENAPRAARWRGYGYLFGYPDDAVDFFVEAGIIGDSTRTLVLRDFRRIDTWHRYPESTGAPPTLSSFVYAVPKGAAPSAQEQALMRAAEPLYKRYVSLRATHVRPDSTGAIALWRAWHGAGRE